MILAFKFHLHVGEGGGGAERESVNGLVSWFSSTLGKGSCQGISGLGLFIRFCMI